MKSFTLIDHTADVRVIAKGSSLEELFSAALEGLCGLMRLEAYKAGDCNEIERFDIESIDSTALLIDFLSSALMYMQTNKCLYPSAEFVEISESNARGKLIGYAVDYFDMDVKAVTYHEADVKKNEDGILECSIVLDI